MALAGCWGDEQSALVNADNPVEKPLLFDESYESPPQPPPLSPNFIDSR